MKKIFAVMLCILLGISFCACAASKPSVYTVRRDGAELTIDRANRTISDGTHTYSYSISGDSGGYSIQITYPDGSSYHWSVQSSGNGASFGYGGGSKDYSDERYVQGETLCDILEDEIPEESDPMQILLIIVLLAVGVFNTVSPHTAWYLENGWRFKNAEPSDLALGMTRLAGIVFIAVAIITFFV